MRAFTDTKAKAIKLAAEQATSHFPAYVLRAPKGKVFTVTNSIYTVDELGEFGFLVVAMVTRNKGGS